MSEMVDLPKTRYNWCREKILDLTLATSAMAGMQEKKVFPSMCCYLAKPCNNNSALYLSPVKNKHRVHTPKYHAWKGCFSILTRGTLLTAQCFSCLLFCKCQTVFLSGTPNTMAPFLSELLPPLYPVCPVHSLSYRLLTRSYRYKARHGI